MSRHLASLLLFYSQMMIVQPNSFYFSSTRSGKATHVTFRPAEKFPPLQRLGLCLRLTNFGKAARQGQGQAAGHNNQM